MGRRTQEILARSQAKFQSHALSRLVPSRPFFRCGIRVWNIFSGEQPYILKGHKGIVNSLSVSADGSFIASKSQEGTVHVACLRKAEFLFEKEKRVAKTRRPVILF